MVRGTRRGKASGLDADAGSFGRTARETRRARERANQRRVRGVLLLREDSRFWSFVARRRGRIARVLLNCAALASLARAVWLFCNAPNLTLGGIVR